MSRLNPEGREEYWCALVVGNSRLHWAVYLDSKLLATWDVASAQVNEGGPQEWSSWRDLSPAFQFISEKHLQWPSLWMLSVVPSKTQFWLTYPHVIRFQLDDIPLEGLYTSLGCDRALAVWAAGEIYGWPTLVIDGGTALTLTGANTHGRFVGGAILPGIALQLRALTEATPLPAIQPSEQTPPRWAHNTVDAILSGVLYTIWAGLADFIQHWSRDYPTSTIVLTGGDYQRIYQGLRTFCCPVPSSMEGAAALLEQGQEPWQDRVVCDETLLFQGIQRLRGKRLESQ